ncbi:hypothetical protein B0H10DRAFT_1946169 [Mycena sp. CBHHK59/15]|nr:hypothetical protein B0H10DRAFT_1946169 [Mycena sp. CBHHK59/15]
MNAGDLETQHRSSKGRLLCSFDQDNWLKSPSASKKGFVLLGIRRAEGSLEHEVILDSNDSTKHVNEITIDLIYDKDKCLPYITFHFNFITPPKRALARRKNIREISPPFHSTIYTHYLSQRNISSAMPHIQQQQKEQITSSQRRWIRDRPAFFQKAAKAEEEMVDTELREHLATIKRRIREKRKMLEA